MSKQFRLPDVAVIGGDKRSKYIAELFYQRGYKTVVSALDGPDSVEHLPLDLAMKSEVVVLPVPVSRDGEFLNGDHAIKLVDITSKAREDSLVVGGMIGDKFAQALTLKGATVIDYFDNDDVAKLNAVPTAEGAAAVAIENSDTMLSGSNCLVVGCGRVGRAMASLLKGMGAKVTVSSRKFKDAAWTALNGCKAAKTAQIGDMLGQFDYIFNTIEYRIFDAQNLSKVRHDAVLIELASGSRGVDLDAAHSLNVNAVYAPALPGRFSPKAAAEILFKEIQDIIEEEFR